MNKGTVENAMRFYILATKLKYKIRSGWDDRHWRVKGRRESVAEHIYGTCILAISISSEFDCDIDLNKVLKMLVLHEIGEVLIGDITPFDGISVEEKFKMEHEAIAKVVGNLIAKDEIISLLYEFDEHKTKESIFAYHCDKFDAVAQSKVYQDLDRFPRLTDQDGNISNELEGSVVLESKNVQKLIKDGSNDIHGVWSKSDRSKFEDDKAFIQMLDYLASIDTQKIE